MKQKEGSMRNSLILGGTKGFGLALAKESLRRNIQPIVTGRSVETATSLPKDAISVLMDLTDNASIENALPILEKPIDYFFWNAAIWRRASFKELALDQIEKTIATNLTGALKVLHHFHKIRIAQKRPYHLVVISSVSAWRLRNHETVYCATKDAQAVFALNFANELAEELPGSRTTIVYPGGMKTEIFKGTKEDTTGFMDPQQIAKVVWEEITHQKEICREIHFIRDKEKNDGSYILEYGPKLRGIK